MESLFASDRNISLEPGASSQWEHLNVKTGPDGLAPAVVQDAGNGQVLMLGYLNAEAWQQTLDSGLITFFSRSRNQLWTKGETSGHYLRLRAAALDCDRDTFLLKADAAGPVCHTGARTCWGESPAEPGFAFLGKLEAIIRNRRDRPDEKSYTASLFAAGLPKIAQKVGEEAVETVIEALGSNRELLLNESADLVFHLLVLLAAKETSLAEVETVLEARHSGPK